jgi:hypothetical protein
MVWVNKMKLSIKDICDFCGVKGNIEGEIATFTAKLSQGEKHLEVYFPWAVKVDFKDVLIDDNASITPVKRDKNILCYNAAVSADSKDNFAVLPIGDSVYYTLDGGKTFQKSKGFSDEVKKTLHHSWTENKVLTSDKNDGNIFYLLAADGFYKSTDRAKSFKKMSSELILTKDAPWRANVESIEGFEGELWVSTVFGVWYSSDFGESFKKIEGLHKGRVSIGKGKTPNSYVLWFNGSLEESHRSIYYSEDKGESFIKVVDSPFIKAKTFSVYGDINRYLRAYIPTSGLGWKYIDVLADK